MAYTFKEFTYASADGKSHIAACLYTPKERTVRGVVQILPDMCDYVGRYRELISLLCDEGYAVCGADYLGHGRTARHSDELGYFAAEDGVETLLTDVHKLTTLVRSQFNGSPLALVGQGMGSLLARLYAGSYSRDIDAVALLGTANNRLASLGAMIARLVIRRKGEGHRGSLLPTLAFGLNNRKANKYDRSGMNWLSREDDAVAAHTVDPFCNFSFTASAYADLFTMLAGVSSPRMAEEYPKSLPTLIAAGDMDPVGNYGRAPRMLAARLSAAGTKDVTLKIYPEARHELVHESNREEFFRDLLTWLSERF